MPIVLIIAMNLAGIFPLKPGQWQHGLFYFIGSMIYTGIVIHFKWHIGEKNYLRILDRLKQAGYFDKDATLETPYDSLTSIGWLLFGLVLNACMILFFAYVGLFLVERSIVVFAK